ncbi:sulfatase [Actinobacteria bacterium YIM 96077]|uniref:Sulfatase n=1 Tax=Phytoactinopolyspora halophila TaxID=1981511 RepID=A0A329QN33_9ACTN|nr:sulfatase [Phytoactinopolyspora halophila]AYY12307.1 sulfatase [Actinobacteria bacterium YIM 96077]RAW13775.1 sulfatase [Phytoactinopolyspora halophila]
MRTPHIVLIHCHDLGTWLSCYGAPHAPTPELERFASEGLVFDQAFATSPLCTPARSALFTGVSPHRNGLMGLTHHGWRYAPGVQTLPELLQGTGVHTTLIGLQHEDPDPCVLGYDEVRGLGFLPRSLQVADEARSWFAEHGRSDDPYLVTIGMWEVHRPWPAEDYDPFPPGDVDVPPYLPDNDETRADLASFYGALRQLDTAIGRVVQAIDQYGDPDNTLVIFTTDHGAAFPGAKGTLYDPGVRVAMIARPPRAWNVPPGRIPGLVTHLDVVPTVLDLCGEQLPAQLEGRSLQPELRGAAERSRRSLYLQKTYHDGYDPIRAVRTDRYKYIRNYTPGPQLKLSKDLEESVTRRGMDDAHLAPRPGEELYALDEDPWESANLAQQPEWRSVRDELAGELDRYMNDLSDPLLAGPVEPPPAPVR